MCLRWYIFCSVSSLDNGTEGGVAKHPAPLFSFKTVGKEKFGRQRSGAGLSRRGLRHPLSIAGGRAHMRCFPSAPEPRRCAGRWTILVFGPVPVALTAPSNATATIHMIRHVQPRHYAGTYPLAPPPHPALPARAADDARPIEIPKTNESASKPCDVVADWCSVSERIPLSGWQRLAVDLLRAILACNWASRILVAWTTAIVWQLRIASPRWPHRRWWCRTRAHSPTQSPHTRTNHSAETFTYNCPYKQFQHDRPRRSKLTPWSCPFCTKPAHFPDRRTHFLRYTHSQDTREPRSQPSPLPSTPLLIATTRLHHR